MKCIHRKCKYYQEHDFNESCGVCNILHRTFKKDRDINCLIEKLVTNREIDLKELKGYCETIRQNQTK